MVRFALATAAIAQAQMCPFSGGETRAPSLPSQAHCPKGTNYVEGGNGKYTLATSESGSCSFGVLGGDCSAMPLGDIERIEFDLSVSEECQRQGCGGSQGDWIAVWLDPHSGWNKDREVDMMETVFGPGNGFAKTNFCTTGNRIDWGLRAPFSQHVTLMGMDSATGDGRDIYVAHCDIGSKSCEAGPGVHGNAFKLNMERQIVYRLVVDNWGNFCGQKGGAATPKCSVTVDNLKVTLASFPGPSPAPSPSPSPTPSPTPSPGPSGWDCRTSFKSGLGGDKNLGGTGDDIDSCHAACAGTANCVAVNWHKTDKHCHIQVGGFSHDDFESSLESSGDWDSCFKAPTVLV